MIVSKLFNDFFNSERAAGIVLIVCAALSIILSNSPFGVDYQHIWHQPLLTESVEYWINDGLMAIFFLLIGLELEREVYAGELSTLKQASLPVIAALGGMIVPASLFLLFNFSKPSASGAGIPMATDIAFAIGILSLLGNRVPTSLKILLTALAVIDDLGAIIVIAIFYTSTLAFGKLLISLSIFLILLLLNRLKVYSLLPYLIGGLCAWYFMLQSGVHATISGVLLAFVIPFGNGDQNSTSYKLQHFLHKPVGFFILPLFALANTSIVVSAGWLDNLTSSASIGILVGLIVGKPLGILLFSFVAVAIGLCTLPSDLKWKHILGVGFLGGIGFTMSIFISLLAYSDPNQITEAKIAVLLSSMISGTIGYFWLRQQLK